MLRDKNLVPLSRQHQHALALCVRIDRALEAGKVDVDEWRAEIQRIFEQEIAIHFAAEEKELFPVAARFSGLRTLVRELKDEHGTLREYFRRCTATKPETEDLRVLVNTLALHIRKEERQFFEGMQKVMSAEELASLGAALNAALNGATRACALPRKPKA